MNRLQVTSLIPDSTPVISDSRPPLSSLLTLSPYFILDSTPRDDPEAYSFLFISLVECSSLPKTVTTTFMMVRAVPKTTKEPGGMGFVMKQT